MRRVIVVAGVVLVGLIPLGVATTPAAQGGALASGRLAAVETWTFAIGNKTLTGDLATRYGGFDLVIVDGQEARRSQIAAVQATGAVVLGYLSVGTIEDFRPWYRKLKQYRIAANKDWEGEFFARVSKRGYRDQIGRRIAPKLYAKGFDGLFLDNVDMIESYKRQSAGMRKLVAQLGRVVHAGGDYLFAQNGFEIIGPMLGHLDGWNREDVSTSYDFDRKRYLERGAKAVGRIQNELRAVAGAGLLVAATDYTAKSSGSIVDRAIENACDAGALPFVSDVNLRRIPPPVGCG